MRDSFHVHGTKFDISRKPCPNGTTTIHTVGTVTEDSLPIFTDTIRSLEKQNDDVTVIEFLTPTCCRVTGYVPVNKIEYSYLDVVTDPNR